MLAVVGQNWFADVGGDGGADCSVVDNCAEIVAVVAVAVEDAVAVAAVVEAVVGAVGETCSSAPVSAVPCAAVPEAQPPSGTWPL